MLCLGDRALYVRSGHNHRKQEIKALLCTRIALPYTILIPAFNYCDIVSIRAEQRSNNPRTSPSIAREAASLVYLMNKR